MFRRSVILATLATPAVARWSPTQPIRLIIAFPPGGSTDVLGRILAPPLSEVLGQPVVPENRTGASGAVASGFVAAAPPDGHTLLLDSGGHAVNPFLMRGLGFDYTTAFTPVTLLATVPLLLVVRDNTTLDELLARPRLNYGSVGIGSRSHLAGAMLLRRAGVTGTHIPYRGGADQIAAQLRGETDFGFSTIALTEGLLNNGRLRALGTPGVRLPRVPSLGFDMYDWIALHAPARTAGPVVRRLADAVDTALNPPAMRARLGGLGLRWAVQGPVGLAELLQRERPIMAALIADEGIRLD